MGHYMTTAWLLTGILLLIAVFLILVFIYVTRNYNYWKLKDVPYIKPLPIVGNLGRVFSGKKQIGMELGELYQKFDGPYFGIYVLDKPYLVLRSPELIKKVLVKDFRIFSNRNFGADPKADPLAANSLFILKNPDWKSLRIQLTPVFTSGKMKLMLPIMKQCGEELENFAFKVSGKTMEMKDICTRFTTDLIASCAFGIEANSFRLENSEFVQVGKRMFKFNFLRGLQLFAYFFAPKLVEIFKLKFIDDLSASFLTKVFWETIDRRTEISMQRNDFVDILIKVRKNENENFKFDGDRMVSTAITFFTAGYETTSNMIAFTLYELCIHPKIQLTLRQEVLQKIQEYGGITYEAVQDMKYLHMVISETLRKYPFGPFLNRHCDEDYLIDETGLVLERGISVLIPLCGLHYDPEYFVEPQKFDPERFSEENKKKIPPCTYIPFGEGPRNCIGDRFGLLSGKVGLIYILKSFSIERSENTPDPIVLNPKSPFLIPTVGFPMKLVQLKSF